MQDRFFVDLFSLIEVVTRENISSYVGVFADVITPLIGSCVALYALYLAYQSLYDAENMMIMESLKTIGSLALCTTIAFSTTWYLNSIVPIIYGIGDDIANVMLGSTSGNTLQEMFNEMMHQFLTVWEKVEFGITDSWGQSILTVITALLILLGYIPFIIVATLYLIVAKLSISLLLIIGPLFIMFAFFPSMRSMFQAWTGLCLNYNLLCILYPIALNIFAMTIDYLVFKDGAVITLFSVMKMLILFACCIGVSWGIPSLCSSVSGGATISGLVTNLGSGARALRGGAGVAAKYSGANAAGRFTGKLAGKGARAAANKAIDKIQSNIKPG